MMPTATAIQGQIIHTKSEPKNIQFGWEASMKLVLLHSSICSLAMREVIKVTKVINYDVHVGATLV